MVKSSTLDTQEIESMMQRINSVPITDTLNMQIIRLDKGECEAHVPREKKWDGIFAVSYTHLTLPTIYSV